MSKLTIGIPAYNNSLTLRKSVESLLAQSFSDFKVLISDDNSQDDTADIAIQIAREDDRVEYIRQPKNLKYQNFGFLLRHARTDYFMWAAGDDRWHPDFVSRCIAELDANPQLVLVTPRVAFEQAGKQVGLSNATYPLLGSRGENIRRYLCAPGDNSRMYGIFRTEAGKLSFPAVSFHAYDWAFCAAILRYGQHAEIPDVLMFRDRSPGENYQILARADGATAFSRIFPVFEMTRWLMSEAELPRTSGIVKALIALNIAKHFEYAEFAHPGYSRAISGFRNTWRRHVEWRLRQ